MSPAKAPCPSLSRRVEYRIKTVANAFAPSIPYLQRIRRMKLSEIPLLPLTLPLSQAREKYEVTFYKLSDNVFGFTCIKNL
jgi:hypothetical protein